MVHRNARPDDAHFGKYNGLGGKLEAGEDVVAGLRREVREEAGIECDDVRLARHGLLAGLRQAGRGLVRLPLPRRPLRRARRSPRTPKARWNGSRWPRAAAAALGGRPALPAAGVRLAHAAVPRRHAVPRRPARGLVVQHWSHGLLTPRFGRIECATRVIRQLPASRPPESCARVSDTIALWRGTRQRLTARHPPGCQEGESVFASPGKFVRRPRGRSASRRGRAVARVPAAAAPRPRRVRRGVGGDRPRRPHRSPSSSCPAPTPATTARELRSRPVVPEPWSTRTSSSTHGVWSVPGYIVVDMELAEATLLDLMLLYHDGLRPAPRARSSSGCTCGRWPRRWTS